MIALFEDRALTCSENLPYEHTDYTIESQFSDINGYFGSSIESSVIRLTCR